MLCSCRVPGHVAKLAPASDPDTPTSCPKTSAAVLNRTSCAVARAPKSRGEDPACHDERVSDDLVSVLWTSSLVEAEIAKGRLEAESIPVQLIGEGADDPFPVGPAELFVPSKFEEEAHRILAQSEDGSDRS
jgi:Putative prokaryotic signal transducing protein